MAATKVLVDRKWVEKGTDRMAARMVEEEVRGKKMVREEVWYGESLIVLNQYPAGTEYVQRRAMKLRSL